jgi:hypothetical protein
MASSEAPDPNPHVPQYIVPTLACDAHCHVFGPAATFPFMPDDGDLVDLVPLIAPDDASRQKLLVENPARLYGWQ